MKWPLRNGGATYPRNVTDTVQTVQYSDSQCTLYTITILARASMLQLVACRAQLYITMTFYTVHVFLFTLISLNFENFLNKLSSHFFRQNSVSGQKYSFCMSVCATPGATYPKPKTFNRYILGISYASGSRRNQVCSMKKAKFVHVFSCVIRILEIS